MQHLKDDAVITDLIEDFGYVIGDMQDYIDQQEPNLLALIENVASGRVSVGDAKSVVRLIAIHVNNDLNDYRALRAKSAQKLRHPYLHPTLRIVLPMREGSPA